MFSSHSSLDRQVSTALNIAVYWAIGSAFTVGKASKGRKVNSNSLAVPMILRSRTTCTVGFCNVTQKSRAYLKISHSLNNFLGWRLGHTLLNSTQLAHDLEGALRQRSGCDLVSFPCSKETHYRLLRAAFGLSPEIYLSVM